MIYVREGGKLEGPEQLKGKRIGVPSGQTAVIYARGYSRIRRACRSTPSTGEAGEREAGRVER